MILILNRGRTLIRLIQTTICGNPRILQKSIYRNFSALNNIRPYSSDLNEKNVIKSKYPDLAIPNCTIVEHIWENISKWPDKDALVCGITGQNYSYAQTEKISTAFAASLRNRLKLQNGDCVAVMLPNVPEFPLATIGAIQAGCVVTTINPLYKADEITRQLQIAKSKVIITFLPCYSEVKKALSLLKSDIPIILIKTKDGLPAGVVNFSEFAEDFSQNTDCLKSVKWNSDDTVFLPFSSGTVGIPKGVQLTHKNVVANCMQGSTDQHALAFPAIGNHQDSTPCVLPFFHIYGLTVTLFKKLYVGTKIVTLPKFTPDTYLNAIVKHKCSVLYIVPPMVIVLSSLPNLRYQMESVKYIMSGAAPLAESDIIQFLDKTNGRISFLQGFGMTETSPCVIMQERMAKNYASVGGPVSNTKVKIVDLNNENVALPANMEGELWVKGPQVMKGYLQNAEANKDIFGPDGWMRTGDIAYYDDKHDFYITDRLKELIKVKSFQVAPAELEAILRSHPDLTDAAVIGIPHPHHGESPKAFVVKKVGTNPSVESIKEFVSSKVSSYKKIHDVAFIESIPKSAAGKILRKEIRTKFT